jgi:RNA-binding protein YhbY
MIRQAIIQLGKNGITANFIETLKNGFKNHNTIRVSVLKSAEGHEKSKIKEMTEELLGELGANYSARIIGFTIVLKKWRKPVR